MKKQKNKAAKSAKKASKPASAKKAPHAAAPKNKVGVTPLGDRVVIRPLSPEEIEGKTTSFGIIIPDTAKEKPEQGTVVAVGAGKYVDGKLVAPAVKVGDKVMFSKYGFDEIKVEGREYYIVSEANILAVLEK